jgi:hypothetical protein
MGVITEQGFSSRFYSLMGVALFGKIQETISWIRENFHVLCSPSIIPLFIYGARIPAIRLRGVASN